MATEAKISYRKRWKLEHREAHLAEKKRYRERHKEQIRLYNLNWQRKNTIKTRLLGENKLDKEQRFFVEGKRQYPLDNLCEICRVEREKGLVYHHWDDDDFSCGIWVCKSCHNAIHYRIRLAKRN